MDTFRQWAKTPPMGWNSWDCYGAGIDEADFRANAAYMASYLKAYGWEYVVCDIQWSEPDVVGHRYRPFADLTMDAYGRLLPAEKRFPSAANGNGFKPLADYVHTLGLKFGLHMMRGIPRQAVSQNVPILGTDKTAREIAHTFSVCPWNTDMYGLQNCPAAQSYYDSVIALYASWGVDFIKCDDIAREMPRCEEELRLLSDAGVPWQTGEIGKVDQGGGGTIAQYVANLNMDVIDCGVPVLSMHSPFEVTAKSDIYMAYRSYVAFYKDR